MNKYFLMAKGALSLLLAYYMPAFIPFIVAYWLGVAFLVWRGKRGLPVPGAPRVAVDYLGGYPGLEATQTIWLTLSAHGMASGGLSVPYGAMRRLRLLKPAEGRGLARSLGYPASGAEALFLAVLWRDGAGVERELLLCLPEGRGAELTGLAQRIEDWRRQLAQQRRNKG